MSTDSIKLCTLKEGQKALIFYPYAGGNISSYMSFMPYLPDDVGLYVFDLHANDSALPGQTIQSVALFCAKLIRQLDSKPIAFFGHSMGALLAYESLRSMDAQQNILHLFVSAHVPPHFRLNGVKRYELDDKDLISIVSDLSGTSTAILESQEFLDMLLPVIRQDFRLCDEYCFQASKEDDAISCPITAFSGKNDPRMPFKNMLGWQDYTNNAFDSYVYSGAHFFIQQHIETITELMMRKLQWH